MSFPFQLYSKFSDSDNSEQQRNHSSNENNSSSNSFDASINKISRAIANAVIRSADTASYANNNHNSDNEMKFKIPTEVLLFAGVVAAKSLLYFAYSAAYKKGIQILDI